MRAHFQNEKLTRRLLILIAVLTLAALMCAGCGKRKAEAAVPAPAAETGGAETAQAEPSAAEGGILADGMEGDTDGMTVIADEVAAESGEAAETVEPDGEGEFYIPDGPGSVYEPEVTETPGETDSEGVSVSEDGEYTSKEEVALYIHLYGHLPSNFISKKEAQKLGWSGGSLADYAPGKSIGGSSFGNYEGLLPEKKGRRYYECDIDYEGGRRNAKRIVYSSDGLIFYTDDHYNSFEQLY